MSTALPPLVQERIIGVLSGEPRIRKVFLYGSRAKGTNRENSDIDLCLDAPDLDYGSLARLETALDDLLLPWKIDLSVLQKIDNPELFDHIRRVGIEWKS
jgi:predicted nucleotidyltransferase